MLKVYEQFCMKHFPSTPAIPSNHVMICHFISYLFMRNYQPSTIASYMSAISFIHKLNCYSDPTDSFLVKKIMKGAQNLRSTCDNRLPITKEILSKLIFAVPLVIPSEYNQFMLRAMMSLAFYCFLRIGEMAVKGGNTTKVLQLSDILISYENRNPINMTVTIKYYKHSNLQPKTITINCDPGNSLCPVLAMSNYLMRVKYSSGPLFQFPCGTSVSYAYFSSALKSLLKFIGLNPEVYKGHSFRIGAATSAAAKGVHLSVIQQMGRWKSNAFKNYIRMQNF